MTISKEERAEWRKEHSSWHGMSIGEDSEIIVRLLDALEAAEARAEAAERERDALAEKLADKCHDLYPNSGSEDWWWKEEWLEWARQQARGGENA